MEEKSRVDIKTLVDVVIKQTFLPALLWSRLMTGGGVWCSRLPVLDDREKSGSGFYLFCIRGKSGSGFDLLCIWGKSRSGFYLLRIRFLFYRSFFVSFFNLLSWILDFVWTRSYLIFDSRVDFCYKKKLNIFRDLSKQPTFNFVLQIEHPCWTLKLDFWYYFFFCGCWGFLYIRILRNL